MRLPEVLRRPFRGHPPIEERPMEQAVELLLDNFQGLSSSLQNIPEDARKTRFLPKDEAWKLMVCTAQAIDQLHYQCPPLPMPEFLEKMIDALKVLKEETGDEENLNISPLLLSHGFSTDVDTRELNLPGDYQSFFTSERERIKVEARNQTTDRAHHPTLGHDSDYDFRLSLFLETSFKRVDVFVFGRHTRPNVSFTDPRENLTMIFPRQDRYAIALSFLEQQGAGPTVVLEDESKRLVKFDKEKVSFQEALIVAELMRFVLEKWLILREVQDIRNWT